METITPNQFFLDENGTPQAVMVPEINYDIDPRFRNPAWPDEIKNIQQATEWMYDRMGWTRITPEEYREFMTKRIEDVEIQRSQLSSAMAIARKAAEERLQKLGRSELSGEVTAVLESFGALPDSGDKIEKGR